MAISCELLIPCLIFFFGADIHSAGSAVLFYIDTDNLRRSVAVQPHGDIAGPLNAVAGWRADGHRKSDRRRGGRAYAASASAEMLKLLLGVILIATATKAFWRKS